MKMCRFHVSYHNSFMQIFLEYSQRSLAANSNFFFKIFRSCFISLIIFIPILNSIGNSMLSNSFSISVKNSMTVRNQLIRSKIYENCLLLIFLIAFSSVYEREFSSSSFSSLININTSSTFFRWLFEVKNLKLSSLCEDFSM